MEEIEMNTYECDIEEQEDQSLFEEATTDSNQPYNFGDWVEFHCKNEILIGEVKGLGWNAGNINNPNNLPTPISAPADNLQIKVDGKRNLIVVPSRNIIKLINKTI